MSDIHLAKTENVLILEFMDPNQTAHAQMDNTKQQIKLVVIAPANVVLVQPQAANVILVEELDIVNQIVSVQMVGLMQEIPMENVNLVKANVIPVTELHIIVLFAQETESHHQIAHLHHHPHNLLKLTIFQSDQLK